MSNKKPNQTKMIPSTEPQKFQIESGIPLPIKTWYRKSFIPRELIGKMRPFESVFIALEGESDKLKLLKLQRTITSFMVRYKKKHPETDWVTATRLQEHISGKLPCDGVRIWRKK